MLRENVATGAVFLGESARSAHEYYSLSRTRTSTADFVLNLFSTVVSSLVLTKSVNREELFEKYDVKLWSYNDNLALFALATIPSTAALAGLFAAYRVLETLRVGVSI